MRILPVLFLGVISVFAKPTVTTSILPTAYFVEQIASDTININTMVQKGADPHTYEPKPSQVKMLEESDIYFGVGMDFEGAWLDKFAKTFPKLMIVQTQDGIKRIAMSHEHCDHGDHDEHHEHHESLDPHIWVDPVLVKTQAKNIALALISKYPQNKALYEENLIKFNKKLDELDSFAKSSFANVKNRAFIVYHPSWGYFAKRYDLKQIPIEIEGKDPKPAKLKELIDETKEEGAKVVFVAPQFSKKAANTIAKQSGARVEEIDQLPRDWDKEMRKSIEAIKKSF